jgi:2-polyprenyl-3-methyl-5-hydroxy-6-metoxy-1,4-benzoquinol methylase
MGHVGLTSRELAPYAKRIVGVDISQASVDVFNAAVADQGIAPEEMRAVCAELKGEEGELDGLTFDVITVRPHLLLHPISHTES